MTENDQKLFQNMRSMITLVDKLRDFNLQDYISLPRIAVLGEQSAGKSSLLESIAGLTFLPRGTGIVTRRPLELRMIRQNVDKPYFVFPKDYGEQKFEDPKTVTKKIEELTDKDAGNGKNISSDPIICRIYSSSVPDLTLVDLPGITRNPVGDQPENIEQITKDLVKLYCQSEDTIILCVIPANIDLSNSDALSFARKLDPRGERTLGVLTKIDLMDEGTNASNTLLNKEIKLKHGYVGVKGRSQADIQKQISIEEAFKKEMNFFHKHPIYSTLPSNLLGTLSLIDRTSTLLYQLIQKSLPKIKTEISHKLDKVKLSLKNLGEEFPNTDQSKLEKVFKLVRDFKEKFDQNLTGKYLQKFVKQKKNNKHQGETLIYQIRNLFNQLFSEYKEKNFKVSTDYTDKDIQKAIEVYQGENIPGFQSFDSFLYLINPKLDLLKQPVFQTMEECKILLEERGNEILDNIFKNYTKLHHEVKEIFLKTLQIYKQKTRKILETIVRCEENYLFTNDALIMKAQVQTQNKNYTFNQLRVMELRTRIDNYFFIVVRNMKDLVPKIIGKNLEVEILNHLNHMDYCLKSMVENKKTLSERDRLKHEYTALMNAENLLVNDFGMTFVPSGTDKIQRRVSEINDKGIIMNEQLMEDIEKMNDEFIQYNISIVNSERERLIREFGLNKAMFQQSQVQSQQKSRKSVQKNSSIQNSNMKNKQDSSRVQQRQNHQSKQSSTQHNSHRKSGNTQQHQTQQTNTQLNNSQKKNINDFQFDNNQTRPKKNSRIKQHIQQNHNQQQQHSKQQNHTQQKYPVKQPKPSTNNLFGMDGPSSKKKDNVSIKFNDSRNKSQQQNYNNQQGQQRQNMNQNKKGKQVPNNNLFIDFF